MSSRGKEWEDGGGTSGWPGGGDGTGAPTPTSGAAPRIDERRPLKACGCARGVRAAHS